MHGKRTQLMFFLLFLLFSLLAVRLEYIQLWQGKSLAAESIAIRSRSISTYQYARGNILDRNQVALTNIDEELGLYFLPRFAQPEELSPMADFLMNLPLIDWASPTDVEDWQERLQALLKTDPNGKLLLSGLSLYQAEIIQQAKWPGLVVAPVYQRYFSPMLAAHVIGYVDGAGEGVSGIELRYDELLKESTRAGHNLKVGLDGRGEVIPGLSGLVGFPGESFSSVILTLDKRIQTIVEEEIGQQIKKGAAVVMDVNTKEILALASLPVFTADNLATALQDTQNKPFLNRALEPYNPGSLFKIATSLAFFQAGLVDLEEVFHCDGHYTFVNGREMACWVGHGHGILTFRNAFAFSCNPVYIQCTLRVGKDNLLEAVRELCLTDETILGYTESLGGRSRVNIAGGEIALANAGLGQDGVWLSPLQMTSLIATVADDGMYRSPQLVRSTIDGDRKITPVEVPEKIRLTSADNAQKVQQLMLDTVTYGTGTKAAVSTCAVAGKTASSQTGRFRDEKEILNVWFGGFFPADSPRYAVVLLKEDGSSGAIDCAPIFARICERILELGG